MTEWRREEDGGWVGEEQVDEGRAGEEEERGSRVCKHGLAQL